MAAGRAAGLRAAALDTGADHRLFPPAPSAAAGVLASHMTATVPLAGSAITTQLLRLLFRRWLEVPASEEPVGDGVLAAEELRAQAWIVAAVGS